MEQLQSKYKSFYADISLRNRIEILAAITIALFFLIIPLAAKSISLLQLLLSFEVSFSAFFIVYYIRKNGQIDKEEPLNNRQDYILFFLKNIDTQLKLLRSARWWYVLPMTAGLVGLQLVKVVTLMASKSAPQEPIVVIAVICCVSLMVIFLNEVYAVNKLNKLKHSIQP